MENHNENNLPDTQMLESQELDTQESQSIYAEETLPIWAKLTYIPTKRVFDLQHEESWFGRETPMNSESMNVFTFDNNNCTSKYLERISKCHFIIEREALKAEDIDKTGINWNPAVITCHGRNGMYVNEQKMAVGERRILIDNDVIKLTKSCVLFAFKYINVLPEYNTFQTECKKKYYIGRIIGSGGCGIVRLCINVKTFEKFAMKVIQKNKNSLSIRDMKTHNEKILNEVNIMKSLSHPNVLNLVDSYESADSVLIIMEFLEGKDMLYRITKYDPNRGRLTEMDAKFFFLQACRGLKYMHDNFITHRDIKPDNILLQSMSPDAVLKISDFGLSKLIAADSMKTLCGTLMYVAPEIFGNKKYTNKVDIWSLGCVLFAMLSGSVPFCDAYGPPDCKAQIMSGSFSFRRNRCWTEISRSAKDLITKMLKKRPEERPSIDSILEHPWLQCSKTIERVHRLYNLNDETLLNSSDETQLENTMVNITLDETVKQPPPKRRRIEY